MNVMMIKVCFAMCMLCLIAFFAVLGYKDWKLGREQREYQTRLELQEDRMEDIVDYWKEIRLLLEDIREKLEHEKLTEELVRRCSSYTSVFITGVAVVDALICYKEQICRDQGIDFDADIKGLPVAQLSDSEYIGVFGNLLDNAIEAAAKTKKPWVKAESAICGGQWVLKITNSKNASANPLADHFMTTKGSGHGLGTKIVTKILKRHNGVIEYQDTGTSFQVMVVLEVE